MEEAEHDLTLSGRKRLAVTGVTEVASFDENTVVLQTAMGTLVIQGTGLQLKNLSLDGGKVAVDGTVSSLIYEEHTQSRGWLSRLFA